MSDYEEIVLVNGPADGRLMLWDGGDYVTIKQRPPVTFMPNATDAFKELMIQTHHYRRDPVQRHRFIWQGEPL